MNVNMYNCYKYAPLNDHCNEFVTCCDDLEILSTDLSLIRIEDLQELILTCRSRLLKIPGSTLQKKMIALCFDAVLESSNLLLRYKFVPANEVSQDPDQYDSPCFSDSAVID